MKKMKVLLVTIISALLFAPLVNVSCSSGGGGAGQSQVATGTPTPTQTQVFSWVTNHSPLPQPTMQKPAKGVSFIDPVFKTKVIRITDAKAEGRQGVVPEYSKRQAWNSDESLMLLRTGNGDTLLYDGNNYKYKKTLSEVGGEDVFWHPTNPVIIYYNPDNTLYRYNVTTGENKKLYTFSDYDFANTRGEGNLSADGNYYAVCGQIYDSVAQEVFYKDLVVLQINTGKIISRHSLPSGIVDFDWVSISPGGGYVVVDYSDTGTGRYHGLEVYDRNLNFLWQKPLGAGHSDLGFDGNGNEVLVITIYDPDKNVNILKKYLLSDGTETTLLELSAYFDMHISMRNETSHEWCYVSTFDFIGRLTDSASDWLPFEDEVFALKLDGSGSVRRIAHHHSRRYSPETPDSDNSVYFAEPHATISRRANRILFGSNWRQNLPEVNGVDTYVVEW